MNQWIFGKDGDVQVSAQKTATCDGINLFQEGNVDNQGDNIHVCDLGAYIEWLQCIAGQLTGYPKTARVQCSNSHATHGFFDIDSTDDDTFIVKDMNGGAMVTIRLDPDKGYIIEVPAHQEVRKLPS